MEKSEAFYRLITSDDDASSSKDNTAASIPDCDIFKSLDHNDLEILESKLRPYYPDDSLEQSVAIYEEHQKLAKNYIEMYFEVQMLKEKKRELEKDATANEVISSQDYLTMLKQEKAMYIKRKSELIGQLKSLKTFQKEDPKKDDFVMI